MNAEKLRHIISIIGEKQVEEVYEVTGGEKISFATLYKQMLIDKIKNRISSGQSFRKIAGDFRISRMTVYRIFRKNILKKSQE
jgi:hypothetical protein